MDKVGLSAYILCVTRPILLMAKHAELRINRTDGGKCAMQESNCLHSLRRAFLQFFSKTFLRKNSAENHPYLTSCSGILNALMKQFPKVVRSFAIRAIQQDSRLN